MRGEWTKMNWRRRLLLSIRHKKLSRDTNRSRSLTDFLQMSELLPISTWTSKWFILFTALTLNHMPSLSHAQSRGFLLILSTPDVGTCLPIYNIKSDVLHSLWQLEGESKISKKLLFLGLYRKIWKRKL